MHAGSLLTEYNGTTVGVQASVAAFWARDKYCMHNEVWGYTEI